MSLLPRAAHLTATVCLALSPLIAAAQNAAPAPNSDATYQQLRSIGLGTEAVSISNFDLKRDAATFHLRSGTVCFVPPVQGKVTGAVFVGDGSMSLTPPLPIENKMLKLLTKEDTFNETFERLILRFTDGTYQELKKAGTAASGSCDAGPLRDMQNALRHNLVLKEGRYNLDGRILEDVLGAAPGGLFVAFIHGKRYNDKEIFAMDPHGAPPFFLSVAPEEVEFLTYDENKLGVWAAFHYSDEYASGKASGSQPNQLIHIEHQQLDTTIEKNANLVGKATTTFVSQVNGLRVVPFDLFHTLRVQSVTADGGQALSFIQEDKNDDSALAVILPKALTMGEKFTLTTNYAGKEAVHNEGGGNYFPDPGARENWYPNSLTGLGDYATYDLSFRIPKGMAITATGTKTSEDNTSSQNYTTWKSEVPLTVAGFNFGRFKMQEAKLTNPEYTVQSYANEEPPDQIKAVLSQINGDLPGQTPSEMAVGNMSTTPLIKKALAEGELAIQLYSSYFGAIPYKRLAMSQQTACGFGQSWPTLVWLPICSFYDATVRHQFGMDQGDRGYWKIVAPHEVAHQWWGHEVGFQSYRDQWMSEGFAEMSASLFIQYIEKNPKKFTEFWNDERLSLLEKDPEGYRAIDAGPVTLGYRMSNTRSGTNITRDLIYPKGAYILHMVRMMMWDKRTGDQQFKETMQDFVKTFGGKAATTEDFKAMVEKHMTADMLTMAEGQRKMDWFFNEYVYGTALPTYDFVQSFDTGADGKVVFNFKLTQSGVTNDFRMLVPVYFEMNDGRVVQMARIRAMGNTTIEQKVPLPMTEKPKRALINYMSDVLASN
jgi:hypothetical protein